jgi:hypothetical protein
VIGEDKSAQTIAEMRADSPIKIDLSASNGDRPNKISQMADLEWKAAKTGEHRPY